MSDHTPNDLKPVSKAVPTRSVLTWDEMHEIQRNNKGNDDVRRLIRHIKFVEHLLNLPKEKD